jgi:hypothetical protein
MGPARSPDHPEESPMSKKTACVARGFVAHPKMRKFLDEFAAKYPLREGEHVIVVEGEKETVYVKRPDGTWLGYCR